MLSLHLQFARWVLSLRQAVTQEQLEIEAKLEAIATPILGADGEDRSKPAARRATAPLSARVMLLGLHTLRTLVRNIAAP